jgi:hypothetical protein
MKKNLVLDLAYAEQILILFLCSSVQSEHATVLFSLRAQGFFFSLPVVFSPGFGPRWICLVFLLPEQLALVSRYSVHDSPTRPGLRSAGPAQHLSRFSVRSCGSA